MSSFLVSKEGLAMITDGVYSCLNTGKIADFPVEVCDLDEYFKDCTYEEIFEELNWLNAYALECRYNDNIDDNMYETDNLIVEEYTIDAYLKMLDCYLYQCCEGNAVEYQLYKIMKEIANVISDKYVNKNTSLSYKNASWG